MAAVLTHREARELFIIVSVFFFYDLFRKQINYVIRQDKAIQIKLALLF
jgi:hypothetical protein